MSAAAGPLPGGGPGPRAGGAGRRVLLVMPSLAEAIYRHTRIRAATSVGPMVGFASLAAALRAEGHAVEALDLDLHPRPRDAYADALRRLRPDVVGITCQTATFEPSLVMAREARAAGALAVLGGPHASALPAGTLAAGDVDAVVVGEGERSFARVVAGEDPADVPGVGCVRDGEPRVNPEGPPIADLDELPLPAWDVFDAAAYAPLMSPLFTRRAPFANVETSRGCPFRCTFCADAGTGYRVKSPGRVVAEFRHAAAHGYREVHVVDDLFSLDMARAKAICEALIADGTDMPWTLDTGIRVDRIDAELAAGLRRSGCWQVSLGIESGSDDVLRGVAKGIDRDTIRGAVGLAADAGLETIGLFIQGLPGETEGSLRDTIAFARSLPLDWATFRLAVPYPGTGLYERWKADGTLRSEEWSLYLRQPTGVPLYELPGLPYETLVDYNERAYRAFYLRLSYAWRKLRTAVRRGRTWTYVKLFFKTPWFGPGRTELQARA